MAQKRKKHLLPERYRKDHFIKVNIYLRLENESSKQKQSLQSLCRYKDHADQICSVTQYAVCKNGSHVGNETPQLHRHLIPSWQLEQMHENKKL